MRRHEAVCGGASRPHSATHQMPGKAGTDTELTHESVLEARRGQRETRADNTEDEQCIDEYGEYDLLSARTTLGLLEPSNSIDRVER
jgi:hypothetical protein